MPVGSGPVVFLCIYLWYSDVGTGSTRTQPGDEWSAGAGGPRQLPMCWSPRLSGRAGRWGLPKWAWPDNPGSMRQESPA